jgi:predicted transcriptional regulator
MVRVSDLMTHSVVTLAPEMSLGEAATTLATMGVSGAPVCDAGGHVVGVFSKSDVVKLDGSIPPVATVQALMTAAVVSVRSSAPLTAAIALFAEKGVHRLMVLGEDDQLEGILTPMDIVRAIAAGKLALTGVAQPGA